MADEKILIVEDERLIRWSIRQRLERESYQVFEAETGKAGIKHLQDQGADLVLLDYKLPDMTGLDILRQIRQTDEDTVVIMVTAYGTVETAVEAMKHGAFDYIGKPCNMDELALLVKKGLEQTALKRQVARLRAALAEQYGFDRIIGASPAMQDLFKVMQDVAGSPSSTVFLRGESGTGKDLVARTIHYNSARAARPFVNITCTALAETLLESELFGHEKGAFTDAKMTKKGLLELADGGTAFLDEVGDMPAALQAKLLRFLEEKTFRRVGGTTDIHVDVRVIAATNRDIEQAIRDKQFREDLFYRLNIIPIYLPPLRQRAGDIALLTNYFIAAFNREFKKGIKGLDEDAERLLESHPWPGNVRELRNAIERAVLLTRNEHLTADDFPLLKGQRPGTAGSGFEVRLPAAGVDMEEVERALVVQALELARNNQTKAAKLLSLSRDQLRYRMEKFGML